MASTINGTSTGSGGLISTGDDSGILNIQTNETTAITVDASQRVAFVAGTAALPAITTTGDTNTGIYFPTADTIAFTEGGAESMRIDSSGNVGIGTSSPNARLEALSSTVGAEVSRFEGNYTGSGTVNLTNWRRSGGAVASVMRYNDANTDMEFGTTTSHSQAFITDGTERMRITSGGSFRFGTIASDSAFFRVENPTNSSGIINLVSLMGSNANNTSSYHLIAATGGADKCYILGNGNLQNVNNSYGALSDVKLKENIVDATPKLANLMQVKVRNYNLKSDPTHKQIGVIAQELEQVFPSMIEESPDRDTEGNILETTTKAVKYSVFVPMLIKAIQELKAMNDTQAETINALTARIVALETA